MRTGYTVKTNAEWATDFKEYKKTGSDILYMELVNALRDIAIPIGRNSYNAYKDLGVSIHEYENEAEYAIYKALEVFDPEKGSLTALLKQLVRWSINDHIIRPSKTENGRVSRQAFRLDAYPVFEMEEGKLVDEALVISESSVYGDVIEPEKERTFVTMLEGLIKDFSTISSDDDKNIIKTVFDVALNDGEFSSKSVNNSLLNIFPDTKMPTIRKKKQRALDRFTNFAKEKGYASIDLSQF